MASSKIKEAIRKKHLYEYREFTHVYRIDDFVMETVRAFLFNMALREKHKIDNGESSQFDMDDIMDISDFLSQTKRPYRSKSITFKK